MPPQRRNAPLRARDNTDHACEPQATYSPLWGEGTYRLSGILSHRDDLVGIANCPRNAFGQRLVFATVCSFDHDADQWLCTRRAQHQTPAT